MTTIETSLPMRKPRSPRTARPGLFVWLLALPLLLAGQGAQAFLWQPITFGTWPYIPQNGSKHGAVYARQLVPGPQGQPVYVEFDPATGAEGREIGEAVGDFAGAQVLAASEYRAWLTRLTDLRQRYPALDLVDAASYRGASYTSADGQAIAKPNLAAGTLWVALRPRALRYSPDRAQLILLELPIDPGKSIGSNTNSVLLNPSTGTILHQSANNIGYRVGFYGDAANPAKVPGRGSDWRRDPDDLIYGPLAGVRVEVAAGNFATGITDDQGKYHTHYRLPPCPGFSHTSITPVELKLHYSRFNPRDSGSRGYTLQRSGPDDCNGESIWTSGSFGVVATMAKPAQSNIDFAIDLMILSGRGRLANPDGAAVPLGERVAFDHRQPALARVAQTQYDLDGDGTPDPARLGRQDTIGGETRFVPMEAADDPPLQGVWLSGVHGPEKLATLNPAVTPPDLTRLADWGADFEDRGLLSQLSETDLRDTDLYVVRESDGSLIAERKGLGANELIADLAGADAGANRFYYTVHLLGDTFSRFSAGGDDGARTEFSQWQAAGGMNPKLSVSSADHLRPGERVRLIAINRASGYQGSLTTELKAAGSGANDREITFPIDELVMGPPNLRLWAERRFNVEAGLTKGEQRDYRIGQEGVAEVNDTQVVIYSEWFDRDGRPLPAALGDYGYTARLAQVIEPNTLALVGSSAERLGHFPIRPGRQVQVVRLPEPTLGRQHLYLQVNGQPHTRNPDFGRSEAGQGALQHRPDRFVPVQVPVFDETATAQATQVYNRLRLQNPTVSRPKPEPLYRWVYRPEFQFSIYDLKMQEIRRSYIDRQTQTQTPQNLLTVEVPVIQSTDLLVALDYGLVAPKHPPLTPYSYRDERELVFALGSQEARATLGSEQTLEFKDLRHLAYAAPEDYLTLRLYSNNDTANPLYEFVFFYVAAAVDLNRDGRVVLDPKPVETVGTLPDKTTPTRPFRFWLNDDYDVVNNMGKPNVDLPFCPAPNGNQVCEQWDEDASATSSNIAPSDPPSDRLGRIETERDLEDFAPLAIRLSAPRDGSSGKIALPAGVTIQMTARKVGINLFRGNWEQGTEYLTDSDKTRAQVQRSASDRYLFELKAGETRPLSALDLDKMFGTDSLARLIFEGTGASPLSCTEDSTDCYVEISIRRRDGSEIASDRVYMNILPVKHYYDHYTLGEGEAQRLGSEILDAFRDQHRGVASGYAPRDTWVAEDPEAIRHRDAYVLFVHGWRMQYPERVQFAETAFKRLYWSGLKARFGFVSWPTGWFFKPAHVYGAREVAYAAEQPQNYGLSESLARRTGAKVAGLLATQGRGKQVHIFAHSMGNVVVSEALRTAAGPLVTTYAACQAAEVASAYDRDQPFIGYGIYDNPESAWRAFNNDSLPDNDFDMPPNHYSFRVPPLHGATLPRFEVETARREQWGPGLYADIKRATGRMVNYHNRVDKALDGWVFNQYTKPDSMGPGPVWEYAYVWDCPYSAWDCLLDKGPDAVDGEQVTDRHTMDGTPLTWIPGPPDEPSADILAHIIPTRTAPLGAVAGTGPTSPVDQPVDLNTGYGFGDSNQGHSAQFYNSYAVRQGYWRRLLLDFRLVTPEAP